MEQLKRLRTERNLSQTKLAQLADLNPATVNQIEKGAREASTATLRKLADALEVSIAELLEDSPKAQAPLPFEEQVEEQRRSRFMVSWAWYMRRRARYWKKVLEEEGNGLSLEERYFDASLQYEVLKTEATSIFETLMAVFQDLDELGPPTQIVQDKEVFGLAVKDLHSVVKEWDEKMDAVLAAVLTGAVEAHKLVLARERVERAKKVRSDAVALFDERRSA